MSTASALDADRLPDHAVVLHVDETATHEPARDWAADRAAAEGRPLVLVAMVTTAPGTALTLPSERRRAEELVGAAAEAVRRRHPDLDVQTVVTSAETMPTLLEMSVGSALVVIGAHPHGIAAVARNRGIDAWVSSRTACPLVVVPRRHRRVGRGVLAGVDLREHSAEVLDFAFRHASLHQLPLTVLTCSRHADEVEEDERRLAEVTAGFTERFPDVHVTREVRQGRPAHQLVLAAQLMDLLVVGRHQPTGLTHSPFGHVRSGVVDRAHCPVAVVPVSS
jgi:nucleotide-binding universal stress UspA family protein